ncbi:MAG TPA: 3-carboxy-cis,cis-muconate cycloisomerase [Variovorax sp.]|nr:3-carboxy-cis,cis-muconate cycloisomerase [Variovorax sp.]
MSIFEGFLSTPEVLDAFSDHHFVDAMLRFEAALARSQAQLGLIPESAAHSIVGSCKVELFDVAKIVRDSARAGSVAIPLVKSLKEAVGLFNADAVPFVHFGSTSQDVIDSAMALVTRNAVKLIDADMGRAIEALLLHATRHATTPMLARTLMQPASVTSFGLKCVGWAAPLVRGRVRLADAASHALKVQLGGAVGTLAQMKDLGPAVRQRMAQELGLADAAGAWHTQRDEWVALGCELGILVGSLGKIAGDIALMGQYEVGELAEPSEPGRGGSSAMPHKRNPVASMVALAAAQRAPQRVAALLAAMPQEHERALGAWQAELGEWPQLLMSAHGSVRALAGALPGLQIHEKRMRANIDTLRAELPREAADEWFDPALAQHAGAVALAQLESLRAQAGSAAKESNR